MIVGSLPQPIVSTSSLTADTLSSPSTTHDIQRKPIIADPIIKPVSIANIKPIEAVAANIKEVATTTDVSASPVPVAATPAPTYSSHSDMMAAAGIAAGDYGAVEYIVSHESGWNPDATNASSGAHGLPQALPYSKTGCGWSDAVCQLQWADGYAKGRYGSWQAAYQFWSVHHYW